MRKLICVISTFLLFFCALTPIADAAFDPSSISTPYIVLMDAQSGHVLYEKNGYEKTFPASVTKIMTCIITLESGKDLNEVVIIDDNVETVGSLMGIARKEEIKLLDLIYGMMLVSGNDAAKAIAVHIAGSEPAFADMMNAKAQELGMAGTHFVKSNGLHHDDHFTTACDMAILSRYAMQNQRFRDIVSTKTHQVPPTNKRSEGYLLENTNKLLYTAPNKASFLYDYATGIKTGSTLNAGRCLVASAKKDGHELILVLLGDYENKVSEDYRFESAKSFFDWAFGSFDRVQASELGLSSTIVRQVSNASFQDTENGSLTINIDLNNATVCALRQELNEIKAEPSKLTSTVNLTDPSLRAPIYEGQALGTITYQYNGKPLFTASLTASRTVAQLGETAGDRPNGTDPLYIEPINGTDKGGGWLFWVLIILLVILVYLVIKLLSRKRQRRMRKAYRVKR